MGDGLRRGPIPGVPGVCGISGGDLTDQDRAEIEQFRAYLRLREARAAIEKHFALGHDNVPARMVRDLSDAAAQFTSSYEGRNQ